MSRRCAVRASGLTRGLGDEHPVLHRMAGSVVDSLRHLRGGLNSFDDSSVWMHHPEFRDGLISREDVWRDTARRSPNSPREFVARGTTRGAHEPNDISDGWRPGTTDGTAPPRGPRLEVTAHKLLRNGG